MNRHLLLATIFILLLRPHLAQAQGSAGDLLARINNLRESLGLAGYSINGALSAAAQSQAQWMAESATISHVRPDGSGPRTRAVNAGYPTTDVSENIYGGTNASVDTAWSFWINSGIHYRGLTEPRFQEVGIGIASSSWGSTFVLVFGNPGGPAPFVPPPAGSSGGGGASAPPSYVRGLDPNGFIMHEIQPEDTLGDIALLYGYTWDDIPYMMQVNGVGDNRSLQIGEIFLVPPHDGTYTPTPGDADSAATSEPESQSAVAEATATPQPTDIPTFTPLPTVAGIATAAAMPEVLAVAMAQPPSATPLEVADESASTSVAPMLAGGTITRSGPSPWLAIALVVQVGLLLLAGFEFVRRARRK